MHPSLTSEHNMRIILTFARGAAENGLPCSCMQSTLGDPEESWISATRRQASGWQTRSNYQAQQSLQCTEGLMDLQTTGSHWPQQLGKHSHVSQAAVRNWKWTGICIKSTSQAGASCTDRSLHLRVDVCTCVPVLQYHSGPELSHRSYL